MGRQRQFDPERALEAAMELFWRQGYRNTSVAELLAAMEINRWSMYETFGDKPQLFLASLTLYHRRWAAVIARHLEQPGSPRAALLGLIRAMGDEIVADKLDRGCLIANSAFELAALEPEARRLVVAGIRRLERAIAATLARAQAAGEVSVAVDAEALARFLVASVNGIRGAAKVGAERDRSHVVGLIELALSTVH